jgi:hypothetical protein
MCDDAPVFCFKLSSGQLEWLPVREYRQNCPPNGVGQEAAVIEHPELGKRKPAFFDMFWPGGPAPESKAKQSPPVPTMGSARQPSLECSDWQSH